MKVGYWYHVASSLIFASFAVYFAFFAPEIVVLREWGIDNGNLWAGIILFVWGILRFFRGWKSFKENNSISTLKFGLNKINTSVRNSQMRSMQDEHPPKSTKNNMNLWLLPFVVSIISCQNFDYSGPGKDVPTAGVIKIGFEQGDSFLVSQWLDIFHSQYPNAKITPVFSEYSPLMQQFIDGDLNGIIVHDSLQPEELNWLKSKKNATVNSVILGYTAPVFISSLKSKREAIKLEEIVKLWGMSKEQSQYSLCFTGANTSNFLCVKNTLEEKGYKPQNRAIQATKLNSDLDVLKYVNEHEYAIGLISLNTIADLKDPLARELRNSFTILKVENFNGDLFWPFQSQISAKQYPFIQPLMSYESQGYSGLITGFTLYANSQAGQALLQKSGLLPAHSAGRKVQVD
jgi:phosphate transport system substrate-binding protein